MDDSEANKHEEGSCSRDAVDPTGKRLQITCVDDGWPHNADRKVQLSFLHQSLAETLGEGVSVGELAENGLCVLNEFIERKTLQVLQLFLRVCVLVVNLLLD